MAGVFFVVALVTRAPFATEHLYAWDSVLYARAIEDFDPAKHQPQPPGYLAYVLLARAVTTLTGDANRALVLISALAGAATVALVYVLARRMYDERTGRIAALLLLTAVTFWAYGGVAYPYTLLAALTTGLALLLWEDAENVARGRRFLIASAAWGIAIGFRSDLAAFVAPLWLFAALRARLLLVAIAGAFLVAAFALTWFLATVLAAGGLEPYLAALSEMSAYIDRTSSVFGRGLDGLALNARELARFLGRGLYALAIPISFLFVVGAREGAQKIARGGGDTEGPRRRRDAPAQGREPPHAAVAGVSGAVRRAGLRGGAIASVLGGGRPGAGAPDVGREGLGVPADERERSLFLALWIAAPLAVYLLVHVGDYGHVFSLLPALAILAARGTRLLAEALRPVLRAHALRATAAALVAANASIFLLTDTPLSARDLARRDAGLAEKVAYVGALSGDVYVVSVYDAVLVEHYVPDERVQVLRHDPYDPAYATTLSRCTPVRRCAVVVWDDLLRTAGEGWEEVRLASGSRLRVAFLASEAVLDTEGLVVTLDESGFARPGRTPRVPTRR